MLFLRFKFRLTVVALALAAALISPPALRAQSSIPGTLNYQGRLTDNTPQQAPVTASLPMQFDLYDAATVGSSLWSETATVSVSGGIFSVALGSVSPIPPYIFANGTDRWLQVIVNPGAAQQILAPRQKLTATGYANQAQRAAVALNSSQLGGIADTGWQKALSGACPAGQYLTTISQGGSPACATPSGTVPNPLALTGSPAGAVISGTNTAVSGTAYGLYGESDSPSGYAVYGYNPGANGVGVYGRDSNGGGAIGVLGEASSGYGVYGKATAGGGYGVYGTNTAGGYAGVFGGPVSISGTAAIGGATSTGPLTVSGGASFGSVTQQMLNLWSTNYGVGVQSSTEYFRTGGGFAWYAGGAHSDTQWNSGGGTTLLTLANNGQLSMNPGSSNYAYLGLTNAGVNTNGSYYGVYTRGTQEGVDSVGGTYGVYGSGGSYGVYGDSANGTAVYARSGTSFGMTALGGNLGLYAAKTDGSHAAYLGAGCCAGDFYGNVSVTGTLSKSAGSFKIDHPLDPENKYLYHSFVESPDMKNIYDGVVITDARGEAVVVMPDWFEALNRDFRYQLTVIGEFAQAIVAKKMAGNRFTVRTSKPRVEVSWQVTGIRKDPYAEAHRIPVEEDKPVEERGHYLHPELYGQGGDAGIEAVRHPEAVKARQADAPHPVSAGP